MATARPPTVPASARLVAEEPAHWQDGAFEAGSEQPIGAHSWWTLEGDPIKHARYDLRGRLLFARSSLDLDRVDWLADRFRGEPDRFDFHPLVGRFDGLVHRRLCAALRGGTALHRLSYASALAYLDQRRGRTLTTTVPRHDLVVELFHEAAETCAAELDDPDTHAFVGLALEAMLALGEEAALKEWAPRWLAVEETPRLRRRGSASLRADLTAFVEGQEAGDAAGWVEHRLRRSGARLVLGARGRAPMLLVDAEDRPTWLADGELCAAPLVVDVTGPTLTPWFLADGPAPERTFFAVPGRGWWLAQRYGRDWCLWGAERDRRTFEVVPVVDVFLRCPDDAWSERVRAVFTAMWAGDPTTRDPFADEEHVWVREYDVDLDRVGAPESVFLGLLGGCVFTQRPPRPKPVRFRAVPRPGFDPAAIVVLASGLDRERATARFDAEERSLFRRGHRLCRIHAVGVAQLGLGMGPRR